MKTIKTPEECIKDQLNVERLTPLQYDGIKRAIEVYHTQFTSTSEEVEKAKEVFIEFWASPYHRENLRLDLNALIELVQNEMKEDPKIEDIKGRTPADLIEGKTVTIKDVEYVTATRAKELMLKFAMCCVQKMTPKMPTEEEIDAIKFIIENSSQDDFASHCVQYMSYEGTTDNSCELAAYWRKQFGIVVRFLSHLQESETPVEKNSIGTDIPLQTNE
jgi:hypothetical protein